jgi:D-alanyl-D-alanine carboxypeptidase-like protein
LFDDLVPELADAARALVDAASAAGLQPRVTSTLRTNSQQARLYRSFLANPGRAFPVAPPGFSAHEYGEAFDMVVTPMEALADVGYTWQQWGGGWNGRDAVHFELPGASARAEQRGRAKADEAPFLVQLAAGLPFGLTAGLIFDLFGIPTAARKNVTPEQLQYLASLIR